jgi:hypothetical protein
MGVLERILHAKKETLGGGGGGGRHLMLSDSEGICWSVSRIGCSGDFSVALLCGYWSML